MPDAGKLIKLLPSVVMTGPLKITKADGTMIEIGQGGSIKMSDEEWKVVINIVPLLQAVAGRNVRAEAAAELPDAGSDVLDNFSADIATKHAVTQDDFRA